MANTSPLPFLTNADLWYRLNVFIYDLKHLATNASSQGRLDEVIPMDHTYFGSPYFTDDEVMMLITLEMEDGSTLSAKVGEVLTERLERRTTKRVQSADYRVCSAHDLAPIYEEVFDINVRDLEHDVVFLNLMEKQGLYLQADQIWQSPRSSSFAYMAHAYDEGGRRTTNALL